MKNKLNEIVKCICNTNVKYNLMYAIFIFALCYWEFVEETVYIKVFNIYYFYIIFILF